MIQLKTIFGTLIFALVTGVTSMQGQALSKDLLQVEFAEYYAQQNYRAMVDSVDHYLDITNDEGIRAFLYMTKANGYVSLSDNPKAEKAYILARKHYLANGDTLGACDADGSLAGVKSSMSDFNAALELFESALECAHRFNDLHLEAQVYNGRGSLYTLIGNYDKALIDLYAALAISEKGGDSLRIGISYLNIGGLYHIQGLYKDAIEFNERAIEIFEQLNNAILIGRTLYNIGSIYLEQKNFKDAETFLVEAETLLRTSGDIEGLVLVLNERARLLLGNDQVDVAKNLLSEAVTVAKANQDNSGQLTALILLSEVSFRRNELRTARETATEALLLARKNSLRIQITEAYDLLYRINKADNRFQDALIMKEYFVATRDSIRNDSNATAMTSFKAKYEYLKKVEADSLKMVAMEKEYLLQVEVADQRRKTSVTVVTASAGFLFLIGFGMYRRRMHRNKLAAKELESQFKEELIEAAETVQENERKRIARDLHDEFAGTLSAAKLSIASIPGIDEKQLETLNFVKGQLAESIATVRRISKDLLPPTLDEFGLAAALQDFAETTAKASGIVFKTKIDHTLPRLEPRRELALYRLVQEMTNNALKHAEAKTFTLKYSMKSGILSLSFADDGKGFDYKAVSQSRSTGLGLKNLINRANRAGGYLDFQSEPGTGTRAEILITQFGSHD